MPTPTLTFNPVTSFSTASNFTVLDPAAIVTDGGNSLNAIQLLLGAGSGSLGISSAGVLSTTGTIGLINYQYNSSKKLLTLRDNTAGQTALGADFTTALKLVAYYRGGALENETQTLSVSLGSPVYSTGNGHYYEFVTAWIDWPTANTAANARTFLGLTGYLATITSSAETMFLTPLFSSYGWGGGTSAGTPGNARIWTWSAGPEAGVNFWNGNITGTAPAGQYSNWFPGEPNNGGQESSVTNIEPYMVLVWGSHFEWNDTAGKFPGYYVEYSTATGTGVDGLAGTRHLSTFTIVAPTPSSIQIITPIEVVVVNGVVINAIGVSLGNVTIGASNGTHVQVSIDLGTNNSGKRRQSQGFRLVGGTERRAAHEERRGRREEGTWRDHLRA